MTCTRHATNSTSSRPRRRLTGTPAHGGALDGRPAETRQTTTIVFTDLVDSTAARVRLGEQAADRLRRLHDSLLETAIDQHAGQLLKSTGDGVHACFDSTQAAVDCAIHIQDILEKYSSSPTAVAPLRARIGISAGDVQWDIVGGRPDCFGLPVIEAARLQAVAQPTEIVCSAAVHLLARSGEAHRFEPLGPIHLKGFDTPIDTFRVTSSTASGNVRSAHGQR